jgi:cell division protein FtsQ
MWFRKRNRRQPAKDSGRRLGWLQVVRQKKFLVASGSVLLAAVMIWSVLALLDRPVQNVEVTGLFLRVSPLEIEQTVLAYSKSSERRGHGFVSLDLNGLKSSIKKIAWVDRVRIERRWPNGVRVTISEQVPGARWGEHGLLNARGELFLQDARFMPAELPQLNGPDGTQAEVADLYLKTYPRLATIGLRLAHVTLDPRGAWELIVTPTQATATNNGGVVVRLGRQDVTERLDRFIVAASPLIALHAGEVSYVDMRYSNGFAVGWTHPNANLANKPNSKGTAPDA